jgi:hypothetical protein
MAASGSGTGESRLYNELLDDYVKSTSTVLKLVAQVRRAVSTFCRSDENAGSLVEFRWLTTTYETSRLHDLAGKYGFNVLERALWKNLSDLRRAESAFKLESYTFLTHGCPGLGFEWRRVESGRSVAVGVQVQQSEYRHYISAHPAPVAEPAWLERGEVCLGEMGDPLCSPENWWHTKVADGLTVGARPSPEKPSAGNSSRKVFTKNKFHYTSCDAESVSFVTLSAAVRQSLTLAKELVAKSEFQQWANAAARG